MPSAASQFSVSTIPIGMLHVPINTILAAPPQWRQSLQLPSPTRADAEIVGSVFPPRERSGLWDEGFPSLAGTQAEIVEMTECCRRLSFFPILLDRTLAEAQLYLRHGFDAVLIENVAAPYFARDWHPFVIYGVLDAIAQAVREQLKLSTVGIQVLAFADNWGMDIAVRRHLDFIRCESALFEGVRPEGRTPNQGNLAKLYMARNQLMTLLGKNGDGPRVYVDVQKKHTVFAPEIDSLDLWLKNILFQKLEGVIITGKATGQPVEEENIRQARNAIEKARADSLASLGATWSPQLIVGSGASMDNISMCKRYADAVIVGSALKKNGYWENSLDEDRVKRFMEAWNG